MAVYVIKSWRASNQPDGSSNYVNIVGRRQGLLSWILSLLGIDPTVTVAISDTRIEFSEASLSGSMRRLIPLPSVCSTVYGYHKPWKEALGIALFLFWIVSSLASVDSRGFHIKDLLTGFFVGAAIALLYFFLNRTLTLGFVENSGVISAIQFKRSVVENQDINEAQAGYVCQVVQFLVESRMQRLGSP